MGCLSILANNNKSLHVCILNLVSIRETIREAFVKPNKSIRETNCSVYILQVILKKDQ